ncbi:MAG: hypothetical protein H8D46_01805 [FCB group bacterium]|nr:hypothetical protein [FCB group bacterium]
MKAFTKLSLIALLLTGFSFSMINCLKFSGELDRSPVRGGETVTMTLNMKLEDGFHIYSVHPDMSLSPTYVDFADSSMFSQFGIMEEPDPHMKFDENFGQVIGYHENRFKLSQQLVISPDLDPGKYQIEATLAYLACDATRCIPKWDDFKVNLDIESGSARPDYKLAVVTDYPSAVAGTESAGSGDADSGEVNLNAEIEKGLLNFLLLAFSMGLLVLLTPCVFPMIPITVSFFAQQGENEGGRPVLSAAVYALGIVVIYSAIGMILSVTLGASGANMIASNPWVNLFIALLFIVFTLSLFGMFELQVPSALRQFSLSQEQKGGMLGVLFMAFTFTLTSFTCTVQFVGLLLVAASQGAFFWPLVGMIAFSSAFALPFFFLAHLELFLGG